MTNTTTNHTTTNQFYFGGAPILQPHFIGNQASNFPGVLMQPHPSTSSICHQLYHQALPVQSNLYQQPMTMSMQTPPQFKHPTFTIQHPTLAVQPTHTFTLDTACSQEIEALKNKVTFHQGRTEPEKDWMRNFRKALKLFIDYGSIAFICGHSSPDPCIADWVYKQKKSSLYQKKIYFMKKIGQL